MAEDIENQTDENLEENEDDLQTGELESKDSGLATDQQEEELEFSKNVREALLRQAKVEYDSTVFDKGPKDKEVYLKDLTERINDDDYSHEDFKTMDELFARAISFQKEQIAFASDQQEKDKRTDTLRELEDAQEEFSDNYKEEKIENKKSEKAPEIQGTLTPKQESIYNQVVFDYEHDIANVEEKMKAYFDLMGEVGDSSEWTDKVAKLKDMRMALIKQKELAEAKLKENSDVKYKNLRDLEDANTRKLADIDQKKIEEKFLQNAQNLENQPDDAVGLALKEGLAEAKVNQKERNALRAELAKSVESEVKVESRFEPEELERAYNARSEQYFINDESRLAIMDLIEGEKSKTEEEFAKKWCLENQEKIGVDLSKETDPKVFLEWAREKNAYQDASYETYGDKITRLLEVKGQMAGEGVGPISKAMALSELNMMSDALQDQLELAISVGDKDLISEKQKQIDNLFKYREQLFCDINGQSLDQYFGQTEYMQRLQNIQDKNEFDKEFKNFMDGEFDKFTYDKPEMVRNIYRSAILEKQMMMADQPLRKKKKEEILKLKQEFDNRGINLQEVAENLSKAAEEEKAKKLGISPEDAPPTPEGETTTDESQDEKEKRTWFEKNQDALAGVLGLAAWIIFGFAGFIIGSAWSLLNDRTPKVFINNFFSWINKKIKDVS